MRLSQRRPKLFTFWLWASIAAIIAGCATPPPPTAPPPPPPPTPVAAPPEPPPPEVLPEKVSQAQTAVAYRNDAASHLYSQNLAHIYSGKMPPLLYAIAVLDVDIDRRGDVISIHWTRKPSQAPEVVAEIERMVHQASPFPAPIRLGRVTYTDVWLWHKSGRFQLDTLTEGQL
jgi:hypothetical protein